MARRWRFDKAIRKLKQKKSTLPIKVGIIAKRHFLASFRKQGWVDQSLRKWKPRKRQDKDKRRRAILVLSGAMRASIRVRQARFSAIRVGSYGIKYARRHNRGINNMPQRQFIGPSKQMTKKIKAMVRKEIKMIFNN